jgi:hypothetical protein
MSMTGMLRKNREFRWSEEQVFLTSPVSLLRWRTYYCRNPMHNLVGATLL